MTVNTRDYIKPFKCVQLQYKQNKKNDVTRQVLLKQML